MRFIVLLLTILGSGPAMAMYPCLPAPGPLTRCLPSLGMLMTNQQATRYSELTSNGTDYAAIKAPASLAAPYTLTLPPDAGTSGQFLQTDGTGVMTWQTATGTSPAIGGTLTGVTAGSVVFGGAGGTFAQDNANLFWDDTNNRLGIGTNSPATTLEVRSSADPAIFIASASGASLRFNNGSSVSEIHSGNPGATAFDFIPDTSHTSSGMRLIDAPVFGPLDTFFQFFTDSSSYTYFEELFGLGLILGTYNGSGGAPILFSFDRVEKARMTNTGNLGLGSTAPGQKLTVEGTIGILEGGSSPTFHTIFQGGDQAGNITYTLPTADGTSGQSLSTNGSGVLSWASSTAPSIGGTLTGGTAGSVIFSGSGTFAQDNANFFWDDTNNRLGLGTTTPGDQLTITGNLRLPATTTTVGQIKQGADTILHTAGTSNIFVGDLAGSLTTTGSFNAGVGASTMNGITSGSGNVSLGSDGNMGLISSGSNNTAIGREVLQGLTSGIKNTGVGSGALRAADGTTGSNTAVGYFALAGATSGGTNVGVGTNAGDTITTGTANTFLGKDADATSGTLTNATAIGANASVSASNSLVLGSSANVGIGSSSPSAKLDVVGTVKITETSGGGNVPHTLTRRNSTTTTSATCSVTCSAGEVATGGGCQNTLALNLSDSYPSADATWSCEYSLATGDCTAWAACFIY